MLDLEEDPPVGFKFQLTEHQLDGLVRAFAANERLWRLFRSYRSFAFKCLPYASLLHIACAYGHLVNGRRELEGLDPRRLTSEQRGERGRELLWFSRACVRLRGRTPLAPLARRIDRESGLPLVDGLQVWALAQASLDDRVLWRGLRRAVRTGGV